MHAAVARTCVGTSGQQRKPEVDGAESVPAVVVALIEQDGPAVRAERLVKVLDGGVLMAAQRVRVRKVGLELDCLVAVGGGMEGNGGKISTGAAKCALGRSPSACTRGGNSSRGKRAHVRAVARRCSPA